MSEARARLLTAATRLFYSQGIHSVGIDRVIADAGVTRATLYRHFPSKDDLLVAYLTEADNTIRAQVAAARTASAGRSPADAVRAVAGTIADGISSPGFRGCAFLNAAAEYPDPGNRVRRVIDDHRKWFFDVLREQAADLGHPEPEHAARVLVLLRDGALHGGELDDAEQVRTTLRRAVDDFLPA